MKREASTICVIFSTILLSAVVNSESLQDAIKDIEGTAQRNITDAREMTISEYLKIYCELGIELLVSDPVCNSQLEVICQKKEILFQMLDASSKYSGLMYGSRFDWGNFDQCLEIDYYYKNGRLMGKYCPFAMMIPDIETGYSDWDKIFKLATCIPDGCSLKMFSSIAKEYQLETFLEQIDLSCVTKESGKDLSLGNLLIMALVILWLGFILICTCCDVYFYMIEQSCVYPNLIGFSLLSNAKKLLEVNKNSPDHVKVLDGMRVISITWIIAGHGFSSWTEFLPATNREDTLQFLKKFYSTYINSAHFAVDTFFYMSGFLVAYNYLRYNPKSMFTQVRSIPTLYLHRYIRLTTSLFILFLCGLWIFPKIGTGPVWITSTNKEADTCKKYWWTFFLYIQNYYNYDDLCIIPTWYLSADMQMFILSPLVLIPLSALLNRKNNILKSMVLLGILNMVLTILPMVITYNITTYNNAFDTHSRLINYTLGITMGAFLQKTKELPYLPIIGKEHLKKISNLMWGIILTEMGLIVLLCQPADVTSNRLLRDLYSGLSKPAWCIGLSWIIYSCYHGYGGIVNWILTRPILGIISKVSYSMYLLHYLVIAHYVLSNRSRLYFSDYQEFHLFCGYFIETLLVSFIWTLVFEYPIIAIEKMMLHRKNKLKDIK